MSALPLLLRAVRRPLRLLNWSLSATLLATPAWAQVPPRPGLPPLSVSAPPTLAPPALPDCVSAALDNPVAGVDCVRHEVDEQAGRAAEAAAAALDLQRLQACLAERGALADWQDLLERARQQPETLLVALRESVPGPHQAWLAQQLATQLEGWLRSPMPPAPVQVATASRETLTGLGERVPLLGCALSAWVAHAPALDWSALGAQPLLAQQQQQLFQTQVAPLLSQAVSRRLMDELIAALEAAEGPVAHLAARGLAMSDVEVREIVDAAFVRRMVLPQLAAGSLALRQHSDLRQQGADATALRASAERTRLALQATESRYQAVLIDVGTTLLRELGSRWIQGSYLPAFMGGGDLYDLTAVGLRSLPQAANFAELALAGTIPEVGAAALSGPLYALAEMHEVGELMVRPTTRAATLGGVNGLWRMTMDELRDRMLASGVPKLVSGSRPRGAAPFERLLSRFGVAAAKALAGPHTALIEQRLKEREEITAELLAAWTP